MRFAKGCCRVLCVLLLIMLGFYLHAKLFDSLLLDRQDYIKGICLDALHENPIIYYQDGSGLPLSEDRDD